MIVGGWGRDGLPPLSLGYVNLLGLAPHPAHLDAARALGARAAHALPVRWLKIAFAVFLAATAVRMLLRRSAGPRPEVALAGGQRRCHRVALVF